MRALLLPIALAAWMCGATAAQAAEAVPTAQDPLSQSRAVRLSEQLRCLVCQNQTIAESNADLAVDLRQQIREQIAQGRSDDDILQYMVSRYGDFVLYKPPFKTLTLFLWLGPALLLVVGVIVLARVLRTRSKMPEPQALTPEERERAARLLAGDAGRETA